MFGCRYVVCRATALCAGAIIAASLLAMGCTRPSMQEGGGAMVVRTPFDSGAWKSGAPGVRHQMARDLIESGLLVGKSRDEVKSLLGEPDHEEKVFLNYLVFSGPNTGHGPAYAVRVELDASGQRVQEARVDTNTGTGDYDLN